MFIDELKRKLKIEDVLITSSVTVLDGKYAIVEGVKRVLLARDNEVRLGSKNTIVTVLGNDLKIVEIGDGGAYVAGNIKAVSCE